MARTKNRPAARSAPHAATDPAPAHGAGPAPDSPAAAVCAALAASPGATTAAIAEAAGIGRPAARDALIAMEQAGTATRVKGGKPGIPDTWTLGGTGQDGVEPDGRPGTGDEPDEGTGQDAADEASNAASAADAGEPGSSAPVGPDPAREAQPGDGTAGERDADAGEQDSGTATDDVPTDTPDEVPGDDATPDAESAPDPGSEGEGQPEDGDGAHGETATPASDDGEADSEQDPAIVSEIIGRLDQIRAAVDAAELVLTANGDLKTALAGLDEVYEQAAQARRTMKAALGGRKTPATRPGGLRERVLAHLDAHPGSEFTPHEIHKVLGNSSGAIANALDTLVKHGDAELATEKPRRYRRTAHPATGAGDTGSAQDGGELAGAA